MHRFLVPTLGTAAEVSLPEGEARHAIQVLRLAPGDSVTLLNGEGAEATGILETVTKRDVTVRLAGWRQHAAPSTEITLIQAVAKGPAMEGLVHRAVELGCRRLIPLLADRSISRPESGQAKQAKWQAIALEAAKQSGNPWRMQVEAPRTPSAWLAGREPFDLLLIASLLAGASGLQSQLDSVHHSSGRDPRTLGLIIGPEGDFTPTEYAAFQAAGALAFTLGPRVLRVETAAIAALALIQGGLMR